MKKIGLLDGHTIQAISIARELKKAGYFTILFCETKFSYGYYSGYADKKVICPSSQKESMEFHKFMVNYLQNEKIDVLIPMNDYSAKYLSIYKKDLHNFTKFTIPEYEIFKMGYDKNELMKICKENNIPHPKTVDLSDLLPEKIEKEITFPALIKPNETTGARGFALVQSISEVLNKLPEIQSEFGQCHLQEFIPQGSNQYKVQIFRYENEIINSTVILKQRYYPINGGSSCFNKTIIDDDIVKICSKVLDLLKWEGFADFDLIQDPRNGEVKIMEINPRVPACIKASLISGINFPILIVESSIATKFTKYEYVPDKYLRYFGMDLLWLFSSKNRYWAFNKWKRYFFSRNHFLQDGSWDDPVPFIVGNLASIFKQLNPSFRKSKRGMQ